MKIILLCLALILPAAAQRKVWTWAPPNQSPTTAHQVIVAVAAPGGLTAMIYAQIGFVEGEQEWDSVGYHAVLISPKGETLANIDAPSATGFQHFVELQGQPTHWKAISVAKTGIVLTDGENMVTFTAKGKTGSITVAANGPFEGGEIVAMPGGPDPLASFLKVKKAGYAGLAHWPFQGVPGAIVQTNFYRVSSIELWSIK